MYYLTKKIQFLIKKEILNWYPPNLQKKVKFYSLSDIKELDGVKCKPCTRNNY